MVVRVNPGKPGTVIVCMVAIYYNYALKSGPLTTKS
jgi:hypothetical protein